MHVKELQARAEAFDKAMEKVTVISDEVQREIETEQQKLDEIREQHSREAHLKDLTADEVAAIRAALAQEYARGQRRGWWSRILFGVIGWAFGLASQALIDMDALGDQLRQWTGIN
jgi:fatty acid desaturase